MFNIFYCDSHIDPSVTKIMYNCVTPSRVIYLYCHSSKVIYFITCRRCSLQYVIETVQKLNETFKLHKAVFKH